MALRRRNVNTTEATDRQVEALKTLGFGDFTAITRTAIDRMYNQEVRAMETREMETRIRVEFSEDGLFGGWSDMDQYDIEGSKRAYEEALGDALAEAFPGADVDVVTGLDVVNDRMQVWVDGIEDNELMYAELVEVVDDVYHGLEWVRYTESGIREVLTDGLWIERADGIVVSVGEIETDEGSAYVLSWHRGPLPAHESRSYSTIDGAMEAMASAHAGDWSDWRPRAD